jgi:GxxExxY protein
LLVEDSVVVELKSVRRISPLHHAQVLSYMKLGGYRLGLLINFAELRLRDGIVRLANSY